MADLCVFAKEAMDRATLWQLRAAVFVAMNVAIQQLDDKTLIAINMLRLFWKQKVS